MKNTALFALALIGINALPGLAQDTTWLDGAGHRTSPETAKSYRIKVKDPIGWQLTYYDASGKIQSQGSYADDSLHIRQGPFVFYDEKGQLYHSLNYSAGKKEGKDTYYFENGSIRAEGPNRSNRHQGEWRGYYSTGKLAALALFDSGRQVYAKFFNEDGAINTKIDSFFRQPAYPEGLSAFSRFVNQHIRYPDMARKFGITGRVIVEFTVSKEGTVTNARVTRSVERSLDEEALRVIRSMPAWEPGIMGGTPTDTDMKLPLSFRLEGS